MCLVFPSCHALLSNIDRLGLFEHLTHKAHRSVSQWPLKSLTYTTHTAVYLNRPNGPLSYPRVPHQLCPIYLHRAALDGHPDCPGQVGLDVAAQDYVAHLSMSRDWTFTPNGRTAYRGGALGLRDNSSKHGQATHSTIVFLLFVCTWMSYLHDTKRHWTKRFLASVCILNSNQNADKLEVVSLQDRS